MNVQKKFPKKLIYQSWFSVFGAEIVAFLVVILLPRSQRNYYRVIISGLLPEAHEQYESRKDATEFVLRRWGGIEGDEIKIISKLLKPSIFLYKYGWLISLGIGFLLIISGIGLSKVISSQKEYIATAESCIQEGEYLTPLKFVDLRDQQSPDFDTGELMVKFIDKGTATDCISILKENNVNINDRSITYEGNIIGTLEVGKDVNTLKIVFKANATRDKINAILRNIAYQHISENIEFGTRKLEFIITDGDGGVSKSLLVPIHFISNKEDIVLPNIYSTPAKENTDFSINGISILIPEQEKINLNLEVSQGKITIKDNVVDGLTTNKIIGNKTSKIQLTGTVSEINKTLADSIIYRGNKDFSGEDNLIVAVDFINSDKGLFWPPVAQNTPILSKSTRINVSPINPPPVITVTNPQMLTQEDTTQTISGISISDPKYQNVTLTLEVSESAKSKIEVNTNIPDGLTANNIINNRSKKVTIKGNINRINNILRNPDGVKYQTQKYTGQDELKIIADNGRKTDIQNISILVNDAPVLTLLEPSATTTTIPEAPPTTSPPIFTSNDIQQEIVKVVTSWLKDGKNKAFGSNYDQQVVYQYTTGVYRDKWLGKIQWLRDNNAIDVFSIPVIQFTGEIKPIGENQVTIEVKVSESFQRYVGGRIDPENTGSSSGLYLFTLQLEQEGWKIAKVEEK